MTRQSLGRLLTLGAALLLAACASVPPARLAVDRSPDHYALDGRFGLRDKDNAYRGRVQWQHSPQVDRVLIQDPFGGGVAELVDQAGGARMQLANGELHEAADAPTLMQTLTGVALPVRSVARWLTGRDLPPEGVTRDSLGRPERLVTAGWKIVYEYDESSADVLPSRVFADNGEGVELRLAIEQWTLEAPR